MSCQVDQLLNHTVLGKVYQYLVQLLTTCSSLISGRGNVFQRKNVPDVRVDIGDVSLRSGHASNRAAASGNIKSFATILWNK